MKLPQLVFAIGLAFAATSCGSDDKDFIDDTSHNDASIADSARADTPAADSAVPDMQTADFATTDTRAADSATTDTRAADSATGDTRTDPAPNDATSDATSDATIVDSAATDSLTDSASGDAGAADSANADTGTVDAAIIDTSLVDTSLADSADSGGPDGADSAEGQTSDGAPADSTDVDVASYLVTVTRDGNGTGTVISNPAGINCGSTCAASFNDGQDVTLTAAPAAGSGFTGWSGSGCMGTAPCTVSVTAASTVTATFTPQYTLTVSKDGNGAGTVTSSPAGINCGPTCAAAFNDGQDVTLTAAPSNGSAFTGWSDSGCPGMAPCTVSVTAASSITATFTLLPRTLTVNMAGTGTGTVSSNPAGIDCGATCSAVYNHGTVVSVFAISGTSGAFMGWSGACAGTGGCSITMNSSRSVTATFEPPLTCTTVSTASICTNGASPQINLGAIAPATCHDQCSIAMRQAGVTMGCWIFAGDGNCYCRSGSLSSGGSRPGGFCN